MDELERDNRRCVLFCDRHGLLDGRIMREPGLAIVVVRSCVTGLRARQLNARPINGFRSAASITAADGVYVVGDRSVKYVAVMLPRKPTLVVFEGLDSLHLPNCPDLFGETVWITMLSTGGSRHRGWARDCYIEAMENDAVVRIRSDVRLPVRREMYYEDMGNNASVVVHSLQRGDTDSATMAFPGTILPEGEREGTGECPVCYETPSPLVTTSCCSRDFCLLCAAMSMGESSRCPWCRSQSGLWKCLMESGHKRVPVKDELLSDIVGAHLETLPDAKVLVVTTDDSYMSPLVSTIVPALRVGARVVKGGHRHVEAAIDALTRPGKRVGVIRADMMVSGLVFRDVTHLVFTETASFRTNRFSFWVSCCPAAVSAVCMVSIHESRI